MGSSTSTADTTQLKNSVASLQSAMSSLQSTVSSLPTKSVDYTQLSNSLVNTSDNLNKITSGIINSPDKLATALTPGLIANTPFVNSINQSISKNTDFTKSVSNLITSDATFKAILKGDKGEPGNIGDYTALKSNLYGSTLTGATNPATIWCADGDLCNIPKGVLGLQFGVGLDREQNAGQISYGKHDGGVDGSLDVIGAGKNGQARVVRVWDALQIGDAIFRQDDDWVRITGNKNDFNAYNRGLAAKNLWARDKLYVANRDILAELDDLKNNVIRKDRKYGIKSSRGGYLSDQGGWKGKPVRDSDWEIMYFDQI
jgi:hypothetical protein